MNGSSYLSLNFTCDFSSSGEMPSTTAPARSNSPYASRMPQAWVVQPGRVVLRIEVEDDGLPAEVGELDRLAAVARELEVRCRLAFLDHLFLSVAL